MWVGQRKGKETDLSEVPRLNEGANALLLDRETDVPVAQSLGWLGPGLGAILQPASSFAPGCRQRCSV